MTAIVWAGLILAVVALLAVDQLVINRTPRQVSPLRAVLMAGYWFLAALAINTAIFFLYRYNVGGIAETARGILSDDEASLQFLAAYAMELSLSLDNVFVIGAVFAYFNLKPEYQPRVLLAGAVIAIFVRAILIFAASFLLTIPYATFFFSLLLVLSALRMIIVRRENLDPSKNIVVRLVRRVAPVSRVVDGPKLITTINGRRAFTLLAVIVLIVETADAFFALDSIPAAYAVTSQPLLILLSNVMALITMRWMYFAISSLTGWIRYLKIGLALVLAYCAVKISLPPQHAPSTEISLLIFGGLVALGGLAALIFGRPQPTTDLTSPLGEDAERLAKLTLAQARKVIVLVIGSTVAIIGLLMLPGPGPGLLVIPVGLAILAAEFVWARRLLAKYTEAAQKAGQKAGDVLVQMPRPWLIPLVIGATASALTIALMFTDLARSLIVSVGVGAFIGQSLWSFSNIARYRKARDEGRRPLRPPFWKVPALWLAAIAAAVICQQYFALPWWKVGAAGAGVFVGLTIWTYLVLFFRRTPA